MKKENKDDLIMYGDDTTVVQTSISDELQKAIQNLIYRLRELGPIPTANGYRKLNSTAR